MDSVRGKEFGVREEREGFWTMLMTDLICPLCLGDDDDNGEKSLAY